jgi:hypothetical protein
MWLKLWLNHMMQLLHSDQQAITLVTPASHPTAALLPERGGKDGGAEKKTEAHALI